MCRLGLFSHMLCSGSDAYISSVPPLLFSGTHPLCLWQRRVSGEQWGGAAEILRRNGVEHGQHTQSTHSRVGLGPIFTY